MPAAPANSDRSSSLVEPRVFVLELYGSPTFAFEATAISDAGEIADSTWFRQACGGFCPDRLVTDSNTRLRPATEQETSVFHDVAEEFAEPATHLLVAHIRAFDP